MLFLEVLKKIGCRKTHEVSTCLWLRCGELWKDNECKKEALRVGENKSTR